MRDNKSNNGVSLLGVLQIVFIVLKLCNLIDWSWWCVLVPTFIGFGIWLIVLIVILGVHVWDAVKN